MNVEPAGKTPKETDAARHYPPRYERLVPLALALIGLLLLVLLVVSLVVLLS